MFIYRLAKTKYIFDLSGQGAKQYGGRWNEKGTQIVYTSGTISLAILESLVHYSISQAPMDMSLAIIKIPDTITNSIFEVNSFGKLPNTWREYPPTIETQKFINKWVKENNSLILKVPSVIIPTEYNYLINPLHVEMNLVSIESISAFSFDSRLL